MIESPDYTTIEEQSGLQGNTFTLHQFFKNIIQLAKRAFTSPKKVLNGFDLKLESQDGHVTATPDKNRDNVFKSTQYSIFTFIPIVVFNQFRVFYNFYFLIISIVYILPIMRVGIWWANLPPILFFLGVSLVKEGNGDYQRMKRDNEINGETFEKIENGKIQQVRSDKIKPGDILIVHPGMRVPADFVILAADRKSEGKVFVKTDQLDGETDWKLRRKVTNLNYKSINELCNGKTFSIKVNSQTKDIQEFSGILETNGQKEELSVENVLWAETVVASGSAAGMVVFTGKKTKSAMNAEKSRFKLGIFEKEADKFSKMLFTLQLLISLVLALSQATEKWYIEFVRYALILSCILPISLRVNLDFGKSYYTYLISKDKSIAKTVVRNPNVCEELGRVTHLLADKTGTLTKNKMCFKKLKTSEKTFNAAKIIDYFKSGDYSEEHALTHFITAMALCHNVTPVNEKGEKIDYNGSSIDEIELVGFAKKAGFELVLRNSGEIHIKTHKTIKKYKTIRVFPFTPARKRMGILLEDFETKETIFISKGAEEAMIKMLDPQDMGGFSSLLEETDTLAMEGFRTLVYAQKILSQEEAAAFKADCENAEEFPGKKRTEDLQKAAEKHLECNMRALGVSGVEDRLQDDVKATIEQLKQAGIKVWVLTGDKVETAVSVGKAAGLISAKKKVIRLNGNCVDLEHIYRDNYNGNNLVVLLDGKALEKYIQNAPALFLMFVKQAEGVILCRSSPTQKAQVVNMLRKTKSRVCAVGDGGNDVGMIKAADSGIGIEGREGQTASLAADVATDQFKNIQKILLWHGRNSYMRSTSLAQLIFHRGVIICVMQAIYSYAVSGKASTLFMAWQLIGYTTLYTSLPVFCLVLDNDLTEKNIMLFPQFYDYLQKENCFSAKVFWKWVLKATYQGVVIILMSILMFGPEDKKSIQMAAFSALVLSELVNISLEIKTWRFLMVLSILLSVGIYSVAAYISYIHDSSYINSTFWAKTALLVIVSVFPIIIWRVSERIYDPPLHLKVDPDM